MMNGQVRVNFAGEGTKELMEQRKELTLKIAASAQMANPSYQVLIHDMPFSFQPKDPKHLKELQKANEMFIQGIQIQRAAWLKKNKQSDKTSGSIFPWIKQAEYAVL